MDKASWDAAKAADDKAKEAAKKEQQQQAHRRRQQEAQKPPEKDLLGLHSGDALNEIAEILGAAEVLETVR